MTESQMRDWLGVQSLRFISLDGLYRAVGQADGRDAAAPQYCDACFSGDYPVAPYDMIEQGFSVKGAPV
jgi:amidophosphoribosyltransferase